MPDSTWLARPLGDRTVREASHADVDDDRRRRGEDRTPAGLAPLPPPVHRPRRHN